MTQRNYGIDALRLWSMLLIVILHIMGQGGVLAAAEGGKAAVSWLIEIIAYCAVNCYALISGYVGYTDEEKPYKYSKYLRLWLQVVCYSFGITLAAHIIRPDVVELSALKYSLFPVTTNHYWYFTAYTALFFFIPAFNRMIRTHSKRQLTGLILLIFVIFSVYTVAVSSIGNDPFALMSGYSFLWLSAMYTVGAWLKRCDIADRVKPVYAWAVILVCVLITWAGKVYLPEKTHLRLLTSYVSPTVLLMAAAYVVIFARMKLSYKAARFIAALSPAAFGVYLIHAQKTLWDHVLPGAFSWIAGSSAWLIPAEVIGCALGVFAVCTVVEKLRMFVFKTLHIDSLADKIGAWIQNAVGSAIDKLGIE